MFVILHFCINELATSPVATKFPATHVRISCVCVCTHGKSLLVCLAQRLSHSRQHFLELFNHLISKLYAPLYKLRFTLSCCVSFTPRPGHAPSVKMFLMNLIILLRCHLPFPFCDLSQQSFDLVRCAFELKKNKVFECLDLHKNADA